MNTLPATATQQEILLHLAEFKITALNLVTKIVTGPEARYLEPRDIKTITDVALNLEDSIKGNVTEGEQARTVQRLLNKYNDNSYYDVDTSQIPEAVIND